MSEFADGIIEALKERLIPEAEALADAVAEDVRDSISVPVEYSGSRVIRSQPAEPPRREFGEYLQSIDSGVNVEGDKIRAEVFTDFPRGDWLENGTSRMAERPHFAPAFSRWQQPATERLSDAATGG